jgi:hypothetical protein
MASPLFSVNGSLAAIAHEATYGVRLVLKLDSMSGVATYEYTVVGWSDADIAEATPLVISDQGGGEVWIPFYADPGDLNGRAILVQCVVNGMRDAQGKIDGTLKRLRVIGTESGLGVIPPVSGETTERDVNIGWLSGRSRAGATPHGALTDRPSAPVVGDQYFDTTLGMPTWWDGSNWIFADGSTAELPS